ncbi:MAG: bifunctional methionine sulfoxide reductase B/A protein [Bacteroidales bacterium]
MKKIYILLFIVTAFTMENNMEAQSPKLYNILSPEESRVILNRGTERPWTGKFTDHKDDGTYVCKQCGAALYRSDDKFDSHCGWPSFDDEIKGAVKRIPDADGMRTEIVCANCGGHLGHVFLGEGFTPLNTRHCVNSVSLDFVPAELQAGRYETALLAGGCFWGVEYYLEKMDGVKSVVSGYTGGKVKNPSYKEVCTGKTGHAEAVKVIFDPAVVSYGEIARMFWRYMTTQVGGAGSRCGDQYRSEIFYTNAAQKGTQLKNCLTELREKRGTGLPPGLRPLLNSTRQRSTTRLLRQQWENAYCHGYTKEILIPGFARRFNSDFVRRFVPDFVRRFIS